MEEPKQQRRYENAQRRKAKQKLQIINTLRETGNIEAACRKVGIARNTYYVWAKDDHEFKIEAEKALVIGTEVVCDTLESRLVARANSGEGWALKYYLGNKHPDYSPRASARKYHRENEQSDEFSDEDERHIEHALKMLEYLEPCEDPSHHGHKMLPPPPPAAVNDKAGDDDEDLDGAFS